MKIIVRVLMLMLLIGTVDAFDFKKQLGITEYDLDTLNIGKLIEQNIDVVKEPNLSSAVTYVLLGSAKQGSDLDEATMFNYKDVVVSDKTIEASESFLFDVALNHTNMTTRSMAFVAIGFAFGNEEKVARRLVDLYFTEDLPLDRKTGILRVLKVGKFKCREAELIVKAGLSGLDTGEVVTAADCIIGNPHLYKHMVPDLVASLLTLNERKKSCPDFERQASVNVAYHFITTALSMYIDECEPYRELISNVADDKSDSIKLQFLSEKKGSEKGVRKKGSE